MSIRKQEASLPPPPTFAAEEICSRRSPISSCTETSWHAQGDWFSLGATVTQFFFTEEPTCGTTDIQFFCFLIPLIFCFSAEKNCSTAFHKEKQPPWVPTGFHRSSSLARRSWISSSSMCAMRSKRTCTNEELHNVPGSPGGK